MLRYIGLEATQFAPLFALDDAALAAMGAARVTCTEKPGFPCRVSLEDAEPGETLLLLTWRHHDTPSPYRAEGPVFVRQAADAAYDSTVLPPVFRGRTLSVRAYDANGFMIEADLAEGPAVEALCERMLTRADVAYLHVHNARPGCFAARVERA